MDSLSINYPPPPYFYQICFPYTDLESVFPANVGFMVVVLTLPPPLPPPFNIGTKAASAENFILIPNLNTLVPKWPFTFKIALN